MNSPPTYASDAAKTRTSLVSTSTPTSCPSTRANGIVNTGLERTVDSLHVYMDEIDLAEEAARHHTARQAEARRLQLQPLRPHADDGGSIREMRRRKDADGAGNLAVAHRALKLVEVAEEARGEEVGRARGRSPRPRPAG